MPRNNVNDSAPLSTVSRRALDGAALRQIAAELEEIAAAKEGQAASASPPSATRLVPCLTPYAKREHGQRSARPLDPAAKQ